MINLLSKINIIDNSGAKEGIMIKRLIPKVSTKNSPATVGDVISISVRKTTPFARKANMNISGGQTIQKKNKIQRKHVYQAIIVRTKKYNNKIKKKEMMKLANTSQYLDKSLGEISTNPITTFEKYSRSFSNVYGALDQIDQSGHQIVPLVDPKVKDRNKSIFISTNTFGSSDKLRSNLSVRPVHLFRFKNNLYSQNLGAHSTIWKDNAAVLVKIVKSDLQPIGTRIKGPICKSLKLQKGCLKIVSISNIN